MMAEKDMSAGALRADSWGETSAPTASDPSFNKATPNHSLTEHQVFKHTAQ